MFLKIFSKKYKNKAKPINPNLDIIVKYKLSCVFGEYKPSPNKNKYI